MKKILVIIIIIYSFFSINLKPVYSAYEGYVTNIPSSSTINSETIPVQEELDRVIEDMLSAGHMRLTAYFLGLGGYPVIFYVTPSETIYTLSIAYPYVSSDLKSNLKTYIDNEISQFDPLQRGYYERVCCKLSDWSGANREYFDTSSLTINFYGNDPPIDPSLIYSLWAYSYNTNDWTYVTNHYAAIENLYNNISTVESYPELAGVVGFARIANHLGESQDYNNALIAAEQGFTNAINFNQFLDTAKQNYPNHSGSYTQHGYTTPIFMYNRNPISVHFNRTIGDFLHNNASSQATSYSEQILTDNPLAWLTAGGMTWGESSYTSPEIPWTYFMIRSYIAKDPTSDLKLMLDRPDRKGDLFYIHKLVATIESEPGKVYFRGDVDHDDNVDNSDMELILTNYNINPSNVVNYYDPIEDSKINIMDVGWVIKDWI
jgi:hypothetical protein